jgi:very-short-patch-repair endonuclease
MEELVLKVLRSPWFILLTGVVGIYCLVKGTRLLYAARVQFRRAMLKKSMPSVARVLTQKKILTPNEQEFYGRLKTALPELEVFPQVAMAAILQTTLNENHPLYWRVRKLFSQKICDYVVCTPQLKLLAVVELDDRTHDAKKDKDAARDSLLNQAGIATVRWDSRAKPDQQAIREKFSKYLAAV